MPSSYRLPGNEAALTGACAFDGRLCAWSGRSAYQWSPQSGWSVLSEAPTAIDSGFELHSGVLAGADTHVGFLPTTGEDWAGWVDLSTFSDAHPLYGGLLLCIDASTEAYALFDITESGLDPISSFGADELADPVAGWSAPTNPERLLLLGEGGLWALSPPYGPADLQHLVSFDDVDLPAFEDIPGPFQPGAATVVVPRRSRTALRLDLSDGTGHPTGLAHLPGGTALWQAYLADDRDRAARLLAALATLPSSPDGNALRLHDVLVADGTIQALATSAGLYVPSGELAGSAGATAELLGAPLDGSRLVTWALWLGWNGAREATCRRLCNTAEPDDVLVDALRVFAGAEAVNTLFDLLQSDDPPAGPDGAYGFPTGALRALVTPEGEKVAPRVASALSSAPIPARVAACAAAGATRAEDPTTDAAAATTPVLWTDEHPLPEEALCANATHDHPALRAAAREACRRLGLEAGSSSVSP